MNLKHDDETKWAAQAGIKENDFSQLIRRILQGVMQTRAFGTRIE